MRLDGYRSGQSLVGLSAHCANSYIPHVQHIIQYICVAGCRNLHSVHSVQLNSVLPHVCVALCSSSPMPVLPFAHLALYRFCNSPLFEVFLENLFFDNGFLHDPVSILHPCTNLKWFLYTLVRVVFPFIAKRLLE